MKHAIGYELFNFFAPTQPVYATKLISTIFLQIYQHINNYTPMVHCNEYMKLYYLKITMQNTTLNLIIVYSVSPLVTTG
jgi:hypothetical protein